MSPRWSSLWLLVPFALLAVLALARLARLRPALRPLVFPVALTATGMVAIGVLGDMGSLSLVILIPVLILCVRGSFLVFQALFQRSQGQVPPALLESVISVLLYGLGAAAIAHYVFGRDVTPLLATSAVVGAVVGLALQDTLGNLFAGIALHTEAPFRVGDWIRIGEQEGRVEQLSWRAMRLRTWPGDTLTIPNNEASRGPILNYSLPAAPHSRSLTIGVNYNTPPNKVISVLSSLLEQVPELPAEPRSQVRIVGYADFTIQYEIRFQDIIVANPTIAVDVSTILSERREALTRAAQDLTTPFEPAESSGELRQRILARIRDYFGV